MKILHVRQTCEREALESHLPVESKPVPLKGGPLSNQVLMWQTGKSFSPKTEYSRLKQTRKTALVRPKRTSLLNTCTQDDSFVLTGGDLRRVFGFLRFRGFLGSFARFIRFSNRSLPPLLKNGNWLEKSSAFSSDRSPLPGLLVQRNNICRIPHHFNNGQIITPKSTLFAELWPAEGPPGGAPYPCRKEKETFEFILSWSLWLVVLGVGVRTTTATTESRKMAVILQRKGREKHTTLIYSPPLWFWTSMWLLSSIDNCQNEVSLTNSTWPYHFRPYVLVL